MLNRSFIVLSLLMIFLGCSVISHNAHAQLFNTSKNKSTQVYRAPQKTTPQSPQENSNASTAEGGNVASDTKTELKLEANASQTSPLPKLSSTVSKHVQAVTFSCLKQWEKQTCMKTLSSLNFTLVTSYAEALRGANKKASIGQLKNGCAASTAALKISVPAYAMRSAMTECVNLMADISDKTSIHPEPSLSQLAVSAILCIGKNKACPEIEKGLFAAAQRK